MAFSFLARDPNYVKSDRKLTEVGTVVESLKAKSDVLRNGDEQSTDGCVGNIEQDWWITLPDEVMISIVSLLPFSSICSLRSVCKKWNSLLLYVDPKLMIARDSSTIPLCSIQFGSNDFICYNPSSNSWHHLPDSFASSAGPVARSNNNRNVLACGCGLLVFEYVDFEDKGLWVFNPSSKSERRLPDTGVGGTTGRIHIHVNDDDLSYKLLAFWNSEVSENLSLVRGVDELHVYDSKTDAWYRFFDPNWNVYPSGTFFSGPLWDVTSAVDHEGQLWYITNDNSDSVYSVRIVEEAAMRRENLQSNEDSHYICKAEISRLPGSITTAHLFLKDDEVMVGGTSYHDEEGEEVYTACIWKPNFDRSLWCEVSHIVLNPKFRMCSFGKATVGGGYMWISDRFGWSGVMCRISTNEWCWLPELPDVFDAIRSKKDEFGRSFDFFPFLFKPEMCLVP